MLRLNKKILLHLMRRMKHKSSDMERICIIFKQLFLSFMIIKTMEFITKCSE